jgi:hypothetical protein
MFHLHFISIGKRISLGILLILLITIGTGSASAGSLRHGAEQGIFNHPGLQAVSSSLVLPTSSGSPLLGDAPDHCGIIGEDQSYESLENAKLWKDNSGLYHLQVKIQYHGSGDYSGLFLNAWMDWHADGQWSDMVVDTYITASSNWVKTTLETTFTQPVGIGVASATWLRVMISEDDWENPCQDFHFYGDHMDLPIVISSSAPVIGDITVRGLGSLNQRPTTGFPVELSSEFTLPPGWSIKNCFWFGMWDPGYGNTSDHCRYQYNAIAGDGPDYKTYGPKTAGLKVVFSYAGVDISATRKVSYNVFFRRDGDDDGDGIPNWFEYWKDDGAVPELSTTTTPIEYKNLGTTSVRGEYNQYFDKIYLGPLAARFFDFGTIAKTSYCPGFTFTQSDGIDSIAMEIAHEARHKWSIYTQWDLDPSAGGWEGLLDSDYHIPTPYYWDYLPDDYETGLAKYKVDSCDLEHNKEPVYAYYGDNEWESMTYADGKKGVPANDWANPGKLAGGLLASMEKSASAQSAGTTQTLSGPPSTGILPLNPTLLYQEMAVLTGSYASSVLDTDGNGLSNSLKLNVGVNVLKAERYSITAWLQQSGSATPIAWATTAADLAVGTQTVDLFFDGVVLRNAGLNGPYQVSRLEMAIGDSELVADAVDNPHITGSYTASSFDVPQVVFNSFSVTGITGGGGLYDLLRIHLNVCAKTAATYTFSGELYGTNILAMAAKTQALPQGASQTVDLDFSGQSIYGNRQDGPYTLKIHVQDAAGNLINFTTGAATSAYTYDQFQHGGTTFDPASYSDLGVDTDTPSNGKYDFLQVTLDVNADQAGNAILSANLVDSHGGFISNITKDVKLNAGVNHLSLDFSGGDIYNHAVDGPYHVTGLTILNIDNEEFDQHPYAYTTALYNYNDFEAPLFTVTGQVTTTGGAGLAGVALSIGSFSAVSNGTGDFEITDVPAGEYSLRAVKSGFHFSPTTYSLEVVDSGILGLNFTASVGDLSYLYLPLTIR